MRDFITFNYNSYLVHNIEMPIKLISWNVNGLRSILTKTKDGKKHTSHIQNNSLSSVIDELKPDIICLQEIRCSDTFDFDDVFNIVESYSSCCCYRWFCND